MDAAVFSGSMLGMLKTERKPGDPQDLLDS